VLWWREQILTVPAGLDDARLFTGNLGEGVTEDVRVVHTDGRDHRDIGVHDIRRIPGPTHAGFDDGDVHRGVREGAVREGDQHLELAHLRATLGRGLRVDHFHHRLDLPPHADVILRVDRLAVDGDALGDQLQVRGGPATSAAVEGPRQGR